MYRKQETFIVFAKYRPRYRSKFLLEIEAIVENIRERVYEGYGFI